MILLCYDYFIFKKSINFYQLDSDLVFCPIRCIFLKLTIASNSNQHYPIQNLFGKSSLKSNHEMMSTFANYIIESNNRINAYNKDFLEVLKKLCLDIDNYKMFSKNLISLQAEFIRGDLRRSERNSR